jgi:hypothetical protein
MTAQPYSRFARKIVSPTEFSSLDNAQDVALIVHATFFVFDFKQNLR